jgi:hypothetical protein
MPEYLKQAAELYSHDPQYGYLYRNGFSDETGRHNAELSGRQMCAVILSGIAPEQAYATAYPSVAEAGNVSSYDQQAGVLAARVLCPPV